MTHTLLPIPLFVDAHPPEHSVEQEVIDGLTMEPPTLPPHLFYDRAGSLLFDRITQLDEYYPTRTEQTILERHGDEMAACVGPNATVIEYGSGSSSKTRTLLNRLIDPRAYVPIDISREHLLEAATEIAALHPGMDVLPVCADYSQRIDDLHDFAHREHAFVFFPGSTIGNFSPSGAAAFLARIGSLVGLHGGLLIGVDLVKDRARLEAAYDDAQGVTAAFNLNMLRHINRRLGPVFNVDAWAHRAVWNETDARIEMHLVAKTDQGVRLGDRLFRFAAGRHIVTEHSHKYTVERFEALAASAGFRRVQTWMDDEQLFSMHYCEVVGDGA